MPTAVAVESHNETSSMAAPTVAVESTKQPTSEVKLFEVAIVADVQTAFKGYVQVYAVDEDEAEEKVQVRIDDQSLDDDLELEDEDTGLTVRYDDVRYGWNYSFSTDGVTVIEEAPDPVDLLKTEIEELEAQVSWDCESLAKQKAFLESLVQDDPVVVAVTAEGASK